MDPNANTNLDPKLKDMYNRVMSTPVPPPVAPIPSAATLPPAPEQIAAPNPTPPQTFMSPTPPAPAAPTPQPETPPTTEMHATIPVPITPKPVSAAIVGGGSAKSKNMKLLPVLLTLGAIIFFGIYAVFWVKFFNLKIPFLPF